MEVVCTRYQDKPADRDEISEHGPSFRKGFRPIALHEVFPTNVQRVIALHQGAVVEREMRWGFLPKWMKPGRPVVNARADKVTASGLWKSAFAARRCLVPATAYFEWSAANPGAKRKTKHRIRPNDQGLFFFAGLWGSFHDKTGDPLDCYTIITTEPNDAVRSIHARMPVILPVDALETWLSPDNITGDGLDRFLRPYAGPMKTKVVGDAEGEGAGDGQLLLGVPPD